MNTNTKIMELMIGAGTTSSAILALTANSRHNKKAAEYGSKPDG
jgi:hypothetical protein